MFYTFKQLRKISSKNTWIIYNVSLRKSLFCIQKISKYSEWLKTPILTPIIMFNSIIQMRYFFFNEL